MSWTCPGLVDTLTLEANSFGKESTMPRSKPPYPRQFRQEAVRLVQTSGRPIAQIARELGSPEGR